MYVTENQIKAARGLLDWTQQDLANRSGLAIDQIRRFENGKSQTVEILNAIHAAFTRQGIEFITEGVRKRQYEIRTLRGQEGFWEFYDDVYETVREQGGDILVHNVDERIFLKWMGQERFEAHSARMGRLDNFRQKIIIQYGDMNFIMNLDATEYRWAADNEFAAAPFYLYGSKLAMLIFEEGDVSIFIIDQPKISESYKVIFMGAWNRATVPSAGKGALKQ